MWTQSRWERDTISIKVREIRKLIESCATQVWSLHTSIYVQLIWGSKEVDGGGFCIVDYAEKKLKIIKIFSLLWEKGQRHDSWAEETCARHDKCYGLSERKKTPTTNWNFIVWLLAIVLNYIAFLFVCCLFGCCCSCWIIFSSLFCDVLHLLQMSTLRKNSLPVQCLHLRLLDRGWAA